jgi:hypothetical protein
MRAIEIDTHIDEDGHIELPDRYRHAFGKSARLLVLLPESSETEVERRRPGSAKGLLQVLAEDDEHLDELRDYMP